MLRCGYLQTPARPPAAVWRGGRPIFVQTCPVWPLESVHTGVTTFLHSPEMATHPSKPLGQSVLDACDIDADVADTAWPAPAPAPIDGAELGQEDTWMTFGLGADGEDEDRTVTVIFRRPAEEEAKPEEFLAGPFSPTFSDTKRRS